MSETLPDEIEKEIVSYGIAVGRSARTKVPDPALAEMARAARSALVSAIAAYGRKEREAAAGRVEAQLARYRSIGAPAAGVERALEEAALAVRAGEMPIPVDTWSSPSRQDADKENRHE